MLPAFLAATFFAAALLFVVQPMMAREVLPLLGGSPAVWNTCMVFFQAALLLGYAWAHGLARLPARVGLALHGALLLGAFVVLPIGISEGSRPEAAGEPIAWLLSALGSGVGLPFFALASAGPLLQCWFARTEHRDAKDPYFLYAASNAGSLIALLAYPLWVEPALGLAVQRMAWSWGFGAFAALALGCGLAALRVGTASGSTIASPTTVAPVAARTRVLWVVLAFVPSSAMLGVTQYLTADIASVPLLWVLPLALYLATFIVAFARRGGPAVRFAGRALLPVAAGLAFLLAASARQPLLPQVAFHLLGLALIGLVCHGRLAETRPPPEQLTGFYLLLALGGVLGGAFNSIVAPLLFDWVAEYRIAILLACLLLPWGARLGVSEASPRAALSVDALLVLLLALAIVGTPSLREWAQIEGGADDDQLAKYALGALVCVCLAPRKVAFCLALAVLLLAPRWTASLTETTLFEDRTFFGLLRVVEEPDGTGNWHHLQHGAILHGTQYDEAPWSRTPTLYYADTGPMGDVIRLLESGTSRRRLALVGLGVGSLAAYGRPPWELVYYEIDPTVVDLARDPKLFTYVAESRSPIRFEIGDARLRLGEVDDGLYDLIVLDAFSSDAIPVHLITREAFELYLRKLTPDGRVVAHVTNWYLDLEPVLAAAAAELGLSARIRDDSSISGKERRMRKQFSTWVVLARDEAALGALAGNPDWKELRVDPRVRVWTDDYSNVLGVLR